MTDKLSKEQAKSCLLALCGRMYKGNDWGDFYSMSCENQIQEILDRIDTTSEVLGKVRAEIAGMENTDMSCREVLEQTNNLNALKQLERDLAIIDKALKGGK